MSSSWHEWVKISSNTKREPKRESIELASSVFDAQQYGSLHCCSVQCYDGDVREGFYADKWREGRDPQAPRDKDKFIFGLKSTHRE